ncbi:MAG: S8 family serine peptidase [Lewinellaceae bacterium]|nr:S8 family serine peptidase [Lewinellaceae bacterium]
MKFCRFSLLLGLIISGCTGGFAQAGTFIPGELLVSLQPRTAPDGLARQIQERLSTETKVEGKVANMLNIWMLRTVPGKEQEVLQWLQTQPEVRFAQLNHILERRITAFQNILPDDPFLPQQWQYVNTGANGGAPNADMDADLAWNIATGGRTPAGDTIVLAVIDGGIEQYHSDLAENLWKNYAEIPDDYTDNDGNGYIDDYLGWNVVAGNDDISGSSTVHGTSVSAVAGARGNNGLGITGVNWDVRIMFVAGGNTVAHILSSYDYVLNARERYNASGGTEGAFVVAVNCSWGINYGQPANAPLWCAAFDSLGQAGILSVASTANIPLNVDVYGDLPTACASDFLVAVTSLNNADQKAPMAAWGPTHIDLGAYGQDIFGTGAEGIYGSFSGTSYAAPQVTGAIGLLYSAPCANLVAMAKADPAAAALFVKNLLLSSSTPNSAMQGITVSGGRLNLYSLLQDYEDQCVACPAPLALTTGAVTSDSAVLKWTEVAGPASVSLRYRPLGFTDWIVLNMVESPYLLDGLNACTTYEFSLAAFCGQDGTSDWSPAETFQTDGCCVPPDALWADGVSTSTATVSWNPLTAADAYRLRIRSGPNPAWQYYDVVVTTLALQNLDACTNYEVQVQTHCDTGWTIYSSPFFFLTAGCGSCNDMEYCTAKADHSEYEWIAAVGIGSWYNDSGNNNAQGYEDYTGMLQNTLQLMPGTIEPVAIIPGFSSSAYKEFFRIYIDFNMDGDFSDPGEMAFDPGWATDDPVYGEMSVPSFSAPGLTRMRVMMKYKSGNSLPPQACEDFGFGQVEDYCVQLSFPVSADEQPGQSRNALHFYPQPATGWARFDIPGSRSAGDWLVSVCDATGKVLFTGIIPSENGVGEIRTADWPSGVYLIRAEQNGRSYSGRLLKQ